jgi:hypothetical protein
MYQRASLRRIRDARDEGSNVGWTRLKIDSEAGWTNDNVVSDRYCDAATIKTNAKLEYDETKQNGP